MDWYLAGDRPEDLPLVRRELLSYLARHGAPSSDFVGTELAIAEALGNALQHSGGPVWVSLMWSASQPVLSVYDLGPGFDATLDIGEGNAVDLLMGMGAEPPTIQQGDLEAAASILNLGTSDLELLQESGRGVLLMQALARSLQARKRSGEGMIVTLGLPVTRRPTVSHDPLRRRHGVLPSIDEAEPTGGFGKESFLRALVVQLAETVEFNHGPDAAEAAVAQVGVDVGGRMEEEFRLAEGVSGRMSPEDLGRCFVRLKHAIDGGFRVLEATPERIVLHNTRCPFGEAVRQAPSLCRMTSSVFGGIAARNSDVGASITLEERIAVGDHTCRVVVNLDQPRQAAGPESHYYATPALDS